MYMYFDTKLSSGMVIAIEPHNTLTLTSSSILIIFLILAKGNSGFFQWS